MSTPTVANFMQEHGWIIWIPMLGSFVTMAGVYWKRHQHPANLILLGLFTIFEAMLIGTITSFYESKIVSRHVSRGLFTDREVLQALFITFGIFVCLTLFTFQTKVGHVTSFYSTSTLMYSTISPPSDHSSLPVSWA